MIPYILVVTFPLFVGMLYKSKVKNTGLTREDPKCQKLLRQYILLAAIPMFFLVALRGYTIGNDTWTYVRVFRDMGKYSWQDVWDGNISGGFARLETGFLLFAKLVRVFTDNGLVFQIVYTTIYLCAVTDFVKQLEEEHFFFLFLFGTLGSYTFMFTGVRQCLAMSICLLSFRFIKKRKFIRFALLVFLAFSFHKSAVLFFITYFIYPRKLSFLNVFSYIGATIFAVLYLGELQEWLNDQLDYNYGVEGEAGGIIFSVLMLTITAFTIFMLFSNRSLTGHSQGLVNVGIIAMACWILRIFTRVAERPSFFFLPFSFAALAYAVATMKDAKEKSIVKILVIVIPLALYVYKFITTFTDFIPYTFYVEWNGIITK